MLQLIVNLSSLKNNNILLADYSRDIYLFIYLFEALIAKSQLEYYVEFASIKMEIYFYTKLGKYVNVMNFIVYICEWSHSEITVTLAAHLILYYILNFEYI